MQYPFRIPIKSEEPYISIHIHPNLPLLFLGTTRGCIDIWDIEKGILMAELRYLEIDDFGEKKAVDDPVVYIASNEDCSLIYGFMGNAAYCIDVEMKIIVNQIPISEQVINGCVSKNTGEVGVVTTVGYISEWSPKFIERVYSFEFLHSLDNSYVTYGEDEELIMVMEDKVVIFGREEDKRYIANLSHDQFNVDLSQYLKPIVHDCNTHYRVYLGTSVIVSEIHTKNPLAERNPFYLGKEAADILLRNSIAELEYEKEYIEDFRLQRRGKDRYIAEIDAIKSHKPIVKGNGRDGELDDAKTLGYALEDYSSDNLQVKSTAKNVIKQICDRNQINFRYLIYAWSLFGHAKINLIDYARLYEFKAYKSEKDIRQYLIISVVSSLLLLIINTISFSQIAILTQIILILILDYSLLRWGKVNKDPKIPWVENYNLFRYSFWIITIYSLIKLYIKFGFQ